MKAFSLAFSCQTKLEEQNMHNQVQGDDKTIMRTNSSTDFVAKIELQICGTNWKIGSNLCSTPQI